MKPIQMTAKFPGNCALCDIPIKRGDPIVFFGKGHAEHKECTEEAEAENPPHEYAEDEAAGFEPGTLANDRRMARRGISVARFSSGAVITQNSKGRCEDAPCCGCCT